jgi:hypothetical protein
MRVIAASLHMETFTTLGRVGTPKELAKVWCVYRNLPAPPARAREVGEGCSAPERAHRIPGEAAWKIAGIRRDAVTAGFKELPNL